MILGLIIFGLILNALGTSILAIHTYKTNQFLAQNYSTVHVGTMDSLKGKKDELKTTNQRIVVGAFISLGLGFILTILGIIFENS